MNIAQIISMHDTRQAAEMILKETDWTQIPNSGLTTSCVTAFETYRDSVRTIRRTVPNNPTWPTVPTEEWS